MKAGSSFRVYYIENDDFLPELELIGFSTLVSANKANLKDSSINIYTGIANVILLVSRIWQNSGVFYIVRNYNREDSFRVSRRQALGCADKCNHLSLADYRQAPSSGGMILPTSSPAFSRAGREDSGVRSRLGRRLCG